MKFVFSPLFLFLILSCRSGIYTPSSSDRCFVRLDSLLRNIDTNKLEIFRRPGVDSVFVFDKSIGNGEGSAFSFDSQGNLGSYSFVNDWPYSNFSIKFKPDGGKQRSDSNEVVQWRFSFPNDSIVKVTVLLCTVDRNYGDLNLHADSFIDSSGVLLQSSFTKIACYKTMFPFTKLGQERKLYLTGKRGEKCGGGTFVFIDSARVPFPEDSAQHGLLR